MCLALGGGDGGGGGGSGGGDGGGGSMMGVYLRGIMFVFTVSGVKITKGFFIFFFVAVMM